MGNDGPDYSNVAAGGQVNVTHPLHVEQHEDGGEDEINLEGLSGSPADVGDASEATLAELKDRIGDEVSPASGTVNKQLADALTAFANLLTELQLKVDLTETQPVSAASLPLPSGAATAANQTTTPGIMGWDGAAWHKLPMVWGYSDRYYEDLGGTKSGAGTYEGAGTVVSAGEIWVIQGVSIRNLTGARGTMQIRCYVDSDFIILASIIVPAQAELLVLTGEFVLKEGDFVRVHQADCLDNDVLQGSVWGYKMKVAE